MFSSQDEYFMRQAIKLAAQAEQNGEVPVGALLVKDGAILAQGYNAVIAQADATAHAEIQVVRQAGRKLKNYRLMDTTLYVTLEPCIMCAGALLHSRIKRIVYGASDPKAGAAGSVLDVFSSSAAFHKAQVQGGLLTEECRQQLQLFFRRRRQEIKQAKQAKQAAQPTLGSSQDE